VPVIVAFGGTGTGYLTTTRSTAELVAVGVPRYVFARFQEPPAASFEKMIKQAQAIAADSTPYSSVVHA